MLVILLREQTITLKLQKLTINLKIMIMIYTLLPEFNTLAADVFNARLAQVDLITITDFNAKLLNLNRKITSIKTKHSLGENELKKLKTFDLSYFIGKSHFEEDGTQSYLVFQSLNKYFKVISNDYFHHGNLKDCLMKILQPLLQVPQLNYYGTKTRVLFSGDCLKQDKVTFDHGKVVNIYSVYQIIKLANIDGSTSSCLTIQNVLFGAVSLTKTPDIDKYKYSGYGVGFDKDHFFHIQAVDMVKV